MAGNRKPGIGLMRVCGLVMVLAGLVAAVTGFADRGPGGMTPGALLVMVGGVLFANGVAKSRRVASAGEGTGAQPSAHEGGDRS
jgi:hypothetical protein